MVLDLARAGPGLVWNRCEPGALRSRHDAVRLRIGVGSGDATLIPGVPPRRCLVPVRSWPSGGCSRSGGGWGWAGLLNFAVVRRSRAGAATADRRRPRRLVVRGLLRPAPVRPDGRALVLRGGLVAVRARRARRRGRGARGAPATATGGGAM